MRYALLLCSLLCLPGCGGDLSGGLASPPVRHWTCHHCMRREELTDKGLGEKPANVCPDCGKTAWELRYWSKRDLRAHGYFWRPGLLAE